MKKTALIFGVTGQDGSYLAEFLLSKKYIVHAVKRKSSSLNTDRIDHIYDKNNNFKLHYGDLTDPISVNQLINSIKPNEIYNLAPITCCCFFQNSSIHSIGRCNRLFKYT